MSDPREGRAGIVATALCALALACTGGAGSEPAATDSLRTDDTGHTLPPNAAPARIVSLVPTLTEILFALGAGDRVVARSDFCDTPPEVRALPSVGNGIRPPVEPLLAVRPDLVLLFAGAENAASIERLRALGVPVFAVRHNDFDDLERNIRRLGAITGRTREADSLVAAIRAGLDSVAARARGQPPARVYYDLWGDPPHTVGGGSYLDRLIRIAGGANVFGNLPQPSPRVQLEAIVAADPDLILVAREPEAPDPVGALRRRPGWDAIPAVREGRIATVDANLVHRLGPRLPRAAEEIARAIERARTAAGTTP